MLWGIVLHRKGWTFMQSSFLRKLLKFTTSSGIDQIEGVLDFV